MTDQHRATPEDWEYIRLRAEDGVGLLNCILELRARVEALEARRPTVQELCQRVEALEAPQHTTPTPEARPAGLVERVAEAMQPGTFDWSAYEDEARAAIREVAKWLRDRYPKSPEAGAVAFNLCQEADRD